MGAKRKIDEKRVAGNQSYVFHIIQYKAAPCWLSAFSFWNKKERSFSRNFQYIKAPPKLIIFFILVLKMGMKN